MTQKKSDPSDNSRLKSEMVGPGFSLATFLKARDICRGAVDEIIGRVKPGMCEAEGQDLIKEVFSSKGVTKFWHPSKFRAGQETLKSFRVLPDQKVRTQQGDLCFIDVGPIIEGHEADFGQTFVVGGGGGDSPLIKACHQVFDQTKNEWHKSGLTGIGLFEFANKSARDLGYRLNSQMAGHRLGDFPHNLFSSDRLFEYGQVPSPNLWVLEIHLLDQMNNRGAFFEDLLIKV